MSIIKKTNDFILKNKYSLFLFNDMRKKFKKIKKFLKLNLKNAFNFIKIKINDK